MPGRRLRPIGLVATALGLLLPGSAPASAVTVPFPLHLPVAPGATVYAGGPHPRDRTDVDVALPLASVDLGVYGREIDVFASAPGVARVEDDDGFRDCFVVISHEGGWETTYYHLRDVDLSIDGQRVEAGRRLGRTAQPGSDTCGFGSPDFPHVHFTISRDGRDLPIDGLSIGGYTVKRGVDDYCGSWTRNRDRRIVVDARRRCGATLGLVNDQLLPPGFAPPPRVDRDGPTTRLSGPTTQRTADSVLVRVTCRDEPCNVRVGGTVSIGRAGRPPRTLPIFSTRVRPILRGRRTPFFGFVPAARELIEASQLGGRAVVARLEVRTTDASGNTTRSSRRVRLTAPPG